MRLPTLHFPHRIGFDGNEIGFDVVCFDFGSSICCRCFVGDFETFRGEFWGMQTRRRRAVRRDGPACHDPWLERRPGGEGAGGGRSVKNQFLGIVIILVILVSLVILAIQPFIIGVTPSSGPRAEGKGKYMVSEDEQICANDARMRGKIRLLYGGNAAISDGKKCFGTF